MQRRHFNLHLVSTLGFAATGLPIGRAGAAEKSAVLKFSMADGTVLALEQQGSGPSILLVHGASGSHLSWAGVAPFLASRFSTFAMDRRGYGESGGAGKHSLRDEATDIATLIDRLPPPVSVVAHSSGAIETLEALRLSTKVHKAVLYEPPLTVAGRSSPEPVCSYVAKKQNDEALLAFYRDYVHMPPGALEGLRASPAWQRQIRSAPSVCYELEALTGYKFDAQGFSSVSTPTLFLLGDQSPPFMAESVKAGVNALPQSRLLMLTGQSHGAMFEAPKMLADIIIGYLSEP